MDRLRACAISAALVALSAWAPPALGCTCIQPPSIEAARDAVDVVFRGTLAKRAGESAVFEVQRVWKGPVSKRFALEWRLENGDCSGFRPDALQIGVDLLVFAKRGKDGIYRTNICYPTKPAAQAREELQALGEGKRPGA
jgi:hypothetical protein